MTPVRRVCGLLLVSAVLLAGCKVDARVDVRLRADGSGTVTTRVTLDADAVRRLTTTAPIAQAVPLADVRASGWKVSRWTRVSGGGEAITFTRDFTGQRDLARRLVELVGATGALRDPTITSTRGYFRASDMIALTVDLRHLSTGIRSDAGVVKALTAAGIDVNALDTQLRGELGKSLTVTITVHAPGGDSKTVRLTAGGSATVAASSSQTYARRIALLAIGGGLLLLALVITGVSLASRRRRRRTS